VSKVPTTQLCRYNETQIFVRERDLCEELIGKVSFTDFMYFQITGKIAGPKERAILDAVLVTLCEHGMTPSAIACRLTHLGAPESLQGAVAAGLLGIGSKFVGTMEGAALVLEELVCAPSPAVAAAEVVARYRASKDFVPGFGHPHHRPDDPRPAALFACARTAGAQGRFIDTLLELGRAMDLAYGRHLTINATGAIAALLLEIDIPPNLMRGFAVVSRAAGLVGHLNEEHRNAGGGALWKACEDAVPYSDDQERDAPS
jgi:citrate synthase